MVAGVSVKILIEFEAVDRRLGGNESQGSCRELKMSNVGGSSHKLRNWIGFLGSPITSEFLTLLVH